jgi:hypothetical protein
MVSLCALPERQSRGQVRKDLAPLLLRSLRRRPGIVCGESRSEQQRQRQRRQPHGDEEDHAAEACNGARCPEGDGVVVVVVVAVNLRRCDNNEPTQSTNIFPIFVRPWEGGGRRRLLGDDGESHGGGDDDGPEGGGEFCVLDTSSTTTIATARWTATMTTTMGRMA